MTESETMKFQGRVLGKWIKGVIFKKAMLSVDFGEGMKPRYYDLPVSMAIWHAVEKGMVIKVLFKKDTDGLWYPV